MNCRGCGVAQTVARRLAVRQAEFESRFGAPEEALYRAEAMRIRNICTGSGSNIFSKKICTVFADFSSKWSRSSLITYYTIHISFEKNFRLKALQQSHYLHLKFASYLVG
jgi:hypothetical protein